MIVAFLGLTLQVLYWPLALAALVFYPIFFLLALPLRLVGIPLAGAFDLIHTLIARPVRALRRA